jgi:hypothetical protein
VFAHRKRAAAAAAAEDEEDEGWTIELTIEGGPERELSA